MTRTTAASGRRVPQDVWRRLEPVVAELFHEDDFHRVDMRSLGCGGAGFMSGPRASG